MNWNNLEIPDKPYYQDEWVTIHNTNCEEDTMGTKKKASVISVYYVPPPAEVVEAMQNANKPRVTIIKGYSVQ